MNDWKMGIKQGIKYSNNAVYFSVQCLWKYINGNTLLNGNTLMGNVGAEREYNEKLFIEKVNE